MPEENDNEIIVTNEPISALRLFEFAAGQFGDMVKAVVDTHRRMAAIGGELHSDEEAALLERGSRQEHLWGINIYVEKPRSEWIQFDSLINVRPRHGNRSRNVEDAAVRQLIQEIMDALIQ